MSIKSIFRSCLIGAVFASGSVFANDRADALIGDMIGALGATVNAEQRASLVAELSRTSKNLESYAPLISSMAVLMREAKHPATRIVMDDMMRQLIANIVTNPERSGVVSFADGANPMVREIYLGVGVSQRDLKAAFALDALAQQNPKRAGDLTVDPARAKQVVARVMQSFSKSPPGNQQFIARFDAWAEGVIAAWPRLSVADRRTASGVTASSTVPSPNLVQSVTGSRDLVLWLAGMDLAFTPQEKAAHPTLMTFLKAGNMSAGATNMVARRAAFGQMAGSIATMMRLNDNLLYGDLSGPSIAGDLMGLE